MKQYKYVLIVSLCWILSCQSGRNLMMIGKIQTISVNTDNAKPLEGKDFIKRIEFIPLENVESAQFAEINKIQYDNKKFYILDLSARDHHLYIFNTDGSFLQKMGKIGKGPGEYLRLCDFDIDENGSVYLYDRQFKKIHIYDSANNFIIDKSIPFRADAFELLENNNYIFSLYNEQTPENQKISKIIVTDENFHAVNEISKFDKNFQDNRGRSGLFMRTSSGHVYNKPADDTVYIFNNNGELEKQYYFDFGPYSLPYEYRNDAFYKIDDKQNDYKLLSTTPVLIRNYCLNPPNNWT